MLDIDKPDFFLHIGTPKTGTTALQSSLIINKSYLNTLGIYFDECNSEGQSKLFFSLQDEVLKSYFGNDFYKDYSADRYKWFFNGCSEDFNDVTESIINEVFKNNCSKVIASNEAFYAIFGVFGMYSIKMLKRIKEAFSVFNIKIVCYLRRQDLFIESLFNQSIKDIEVDLLLNTQGNKNYNLFNHVFEEVEHYSDFQNFCKNMINITDYYNILDVWAKIFGKENIIIRPYESLQLPNSITYDFYHEILGLNNEQLNKLKPYSVTNDRLIRDVLEFKLKTKSFYMHSDFAAVSKLMDTKNDNQVYFSDAERFKLMNYYKESNEKIAKEYLNRVNGILFYEKVEKMNPYSGLTLDMAILISKKLIARRLSEEDEKEILKSLFAFAEAQKKSIAICGVNSEKVSIVFNVATIFNKTVNIAIVDEGLSKRYCSIQDVRYKVYKYEELEELCPDIILTTTINSGLDIYNTLEKLELKNTLVCPVYDYSDDIWHSYKIKDSKT